MLNVIEVKTCTDVVYRSRVESRLVLKLACARTYSSVRGKYVASLLI